MVNRASGRLLPALCTLSLCISTAQAGNTGGVFGPVISAQDRSIQYRYAQNSTELDSNEDFTHRLHYQNALDQSTRLRVVGQFREGEDGHNFDQLRLEGQWQFRDSRQQPNRWDSALRLDVVKRRGNLPTDLGINWTNQWALSETVKLTAVLLSARQFGDSRLAGLQISSRFSLAYRYHGSHTLALESFNNHGPLNHLQLAGHRPQQIGPALSGRWQKLGYKLGYLRGTTSVAPDDTLALWFTYAL